MTVQVSSTSVPRENIDKTHGKPLQPWNKNEFEWQGTSLYSVVNINLTKLYMYEVKRNVNSWYSRPLTSLWLAWQRHGTEHLYHQFSTDPNRSQPWGVRKFGKKHHHGSPGKNYWSTQWTWCHRHAPRGHQRNFMDCSCTSGETSTLMMPTGLGNTFRNQLNMILSHPIPVSPIRVCPGCNKEVGEPRDSHSCICLVTICLPEVWTLHRRQYRRPNTTYGFSWMMMVISMHTRVRSPETLASCLSQWLAIE